PRRHSITSSARTSNDGGTSSPTDEGEGGDFVRYGLGGAHQHDGVTNGPCLLPARRERPRRRAAEQRDELAPPHSIPWSARASRDGGPSRPSALAVLRLIVSSYLVGCCTGRSAGFAPLRIRWT